MISIYNNRELVLSVADFISNNRQRAYIGMKGDTTYYNVNGMVWEVWQDGCGNYPTTNNIPVKSFEI